MKFAIFATGGTIASAPSDEGLRPALSSEELVALCPDLMGFEHDVLFVDLMSKDSTDMRPDDWLLMADEIRARAPSCDAAIVLHGTDTLAWTAAALSLLLNDLSIPVVLTGSMLPAGVLDSDASDNVFAAVQSAMQLAMYRRGGVSVAFDGTLIHGPRSTKIDARRKHAFISVDYPILGEMRDRDTHKIAWLGPHVPVLSPDRPWGPSPAIERDIALIPIFPGMRAALLDAVIATAPRALVLEGYGMGGVPSTDDDLLPSIERAVASGTHVVVKGQPLFGGTDLSVYEPGRRAMGLGAISARDMGREALMAKLMLLLPLCPGRDELERLLHEPLCDEVRG